jgi:hypothetical protein
MRKSLPMPVRFSVFPSLSYSSFKVLGLTLRSLIHSELILVQGERQGSRFQSSTCKYPVFPAPFVEQAVFSPVYDFGSFVKNQMVIAM